MKLFNIDLHISIIADMKKIFTDLDHEVYDLSLSEHTWVFNRLKDSVPMLDNGRWNSLTPNQLSDEFYFFYKDKLDEYDAFIVTYPPTFALLYKHFKKPIIINNPIRYEWPFSFRKADWEYFNIFLREGVDAGLIKLVANNLYDKYYMEDFIERDVEHIPSICDYYGEYYSPNDNHFIYYSKDRINEINHPNIKYKDDLFATHTHKDLVKFKGIVHIPYQVSYMSIFEQYTSNIPLFVPTKEFLMKLYKERKYNILKEVSWNNYFNTIDKSIIEYKKEYDPNAYNNMEAVEHWLQFADFYDEEWMPYIIYFSSFEELHTLLDTIDVNIVSEKMRIFNETRKSKIYDKWNKLLNEIK
jgi:hypothetical protein